jgi:hypothetical protein
VNTEGFLPNLETHLAPVLATQIKSELLASKSETTSQTEGANGAMYSAKKAHHPLLLQILAEELNCTVEEILDFELSVCDTQPSCIGGARKEFIFSGRLDNLASSFCALRALLDTCEDAASLTDESCIRAVALFDNEEVGSDSAQGAGSPVMFQAMNRITRWLVRETPSEGIVERTIRRSFLGLSVHYLSFTLDCGCIVSQKDRLQAVDQTEFGSLSFPVVQWTRTSDYVFHESFLFCNITHIISVFVLILLTWVELDGQYLQTWLMHCTQTMLRGMRITINPSSMRV